MQGYLIKLVSADGLKSDVRWVEDCYHPIYTALRPKLTVTEPDPTMVRISQRMYRFEGRIEQPGKIYLLDEVI